MKIANATALVTGANRGIGRELVRALITDGAARIYATGRNLEALQGVAETDTARIVPLKVDVTDRAAVDSLPRLAPNVTLLFNNAGLLEFGGILDAPIDRVSREFETNFWGKLMMARAFAPVIEANGGGAIVNMLTLVAMASAPGMAAYNASKAAAWSMTQSLRASLAATGVSVHAVFPGAVDTEMLAKVEMPKTSPADVAAAIVAGIVAGDEDIFPDPMAEQVYAAWRHDHKAVERQFAAM